MGIMEDMTLDTLKILAGIYDLDVVKDTRTVLKGYTTTCYRIVDKNDKVIYNSDSNIGIYGWLTGYGCGFRKGKDENDE